MRYLEQRRRFRKTKAARRRLFGGGLLIAGLAGIILSIPTGSDYTVSQRESASNGITEELVITKVAQSSDEAPVLALLEEEPTGEVALGFSPTGSPEYMTTQAPLFEIPAPLLFADNWNPSSPVSTGDTDTQPVVRPQRAPTIAGVPGGGSGGPNASGPQGPGPSLGGGAPGGGGSSPGNPSSPSTSGPSAPPSDPTPGDTGPTVAGPTITPPATPNPGPQTASVPDAPTNPPTNNQPGPVDLPDELTGPVVGLNNDPQDDWQSPGHSPGILKLDNFTLGGQTLLFEILGPSADDPVQYDQLIVSGDVILDSGNIVFAFIDGYVPPNADVLFNLIVAGDIYGANTDGTITEDVHFYYGFFDTPYNLHAPYDLSYYTMWTPGSVIAKEIVDLDVQKALQIKYNGSSDDPPANSASRDGEPQPFDPVDIGAEIPTPAPLLLLATGLLLAGSFRRRA